MTLARPTAALLLAAVLGLSGCQDSGERAQSFFEEGVALREAGDLSRAAVSFRNVFRFEGTHKEARTQLAEVLLEQGDPGAAFSQYLRLAEQYPDDPAVRLALSEIAVGLQAWPELRRHGAVAVELAPDLPRSRAVAAAIDYIEAIEAEDGAGSEAAMARAEALLAQDPELDVARRLVIAGHLEAGRLEQALPRLDEAIARSPEERALLLTKLQVLNRLDRPDEVEAMLVELYERDPEDEEIRETLLSWYVDQDNPDAAGEVLRARAEAPGATVEDDVTFIGFVARTRGEDAAREVLAESIAARADDPARVDRYVRLDADLAFAQGDAEGAIDMLRARLDDDVEGPDDDALRTQLARMLVATGEQVGARALVEEVLESDPGNVDALKMRAEWLIEADEPTAAITALRAALDQAPRDPDIVTMMARAHLREGSTALAGERLALAADLSGNAPEEVLRYAAFLTDQGRVDAARSLVDEAVRSDPANLALLSEQARRALAAGDAAAARAAVGAISALGEDDPVAADRASVLGAALLLSQDRLDEGLSLLEARAEGAEAPAAVVLDVVRTRLAAGRVEEARTFLDARLAERPDDPSLRFADAAMRLAEGESGVAERIFASLIEEFPASEAAVLRLHDLLLGEGRDAEAEAVLAAGLERMPRSIPLLRRQATVAEMGGDAEQALAIYAAAYEIDGDDVVVANNYASLLSDLRDDPESLSRAASIARRLGDSGNPALQDTYGWIAFRQGRPEEALRYLEPAAEGLPDNPVVIYHLGMALVAAGREAEGREALARAVALGEGTAFPQVAAAREALASLDAAPAPATTTGATTGTTAQP